MTAKSPLFKGSCFAIFNTYKAEYIDKELVVCLQACDFATLMDMYKEVVMGKVDDEKLQYIIKKIEELDYGTVQITVHDHEITQIESTEKKRYPVRKR